MKNAIIVFFVLTARIAAASSYDLDPGSFRMLVLESEYIIVGYVMEVNLLEEEDFRIAPTGILKIKIVEALQGTIKDEIIDVPFEPDLTASTPEYKTGDLVLGFFKKDSVGNYYSRESTGGARTLSVADVALYKTRIKEMQQIATITDVHKKFMETIEWLVKGMEQEATRFETSFELMDFNLHYSRPELMFGKLLSEKQKLRLKKVLLETPASYPCDFTIVDLLYADYKTEIQSYLLQRLKNLQGYELWMAGEYMNLLMDGKNSPEMKKIVADFSEIKLRRSKEKELKMMVSEFIVLAER